MPADKTMMPSDGGFMADGGGVDPVSGNDVPVGSLKEEVRDDVDAKLSPGEFVIPADVVRFIGLERLMKLRDKAKEGLQRMNEVGQMGNAEEVGDKATEPFAAEDEEDIAGFETEIDDILKEDESEQTEKAFAPGGFVSGEDITKAPKNPMVDVRYYKNDDGRVMFITHINGKPMTAVPDGFKEVDAAEANLVGKKADEAKEVAKEEAAATNTTSSSAPFGRDADGMALTSPTGGTAGNGTNLTDAQWSAVKALRDQYGWDNAFDKENAKSFGKIVAGMLGGGVIGAAAAAVRAVMGAESKKDLEGMNLVDYQIAEAALKKDRERGVVNNAPVEDRQGIPVQDIYDPTTATRRVDFEKPAADNEYGMDDGLPAPTPVQTGSPPITATPDSTPVSENTTDSDSDGYSYYSTYAAKGGLITKRQHPAKKQKGKGISMSRK